MVHGWLSTGWWGATVIANLLGDCMFVCECVWRGWGSSGEAIPGGASSGKKTEAISKMWCLVRSD